MQIDRYELEADFYFSTFEFLSEGPKGSILKSVQFQTTLSPNVYNLAFGDKNSETGEIDDRVVTDNGDTKKVLSTVVAALYSFSKAFPNAWVYATGSTSSRTRLYRMGINKHFEIVEADFDVMGQTGHEWEVYKPGKDYKAFAVRRKTNKFDL